MDDTEQLELCYNRGCGQKFNPEDNKDDSCRHHPGEPFFHDAIKGWSCCNKKCTDFTEFLNFPGCTVAKHSNVKPADPVKPKQEMIDSPEYVEIRPLVITPCQLARPPLDQPMIDVKPEIAPSLASQMEDIETFVNDESRKSDEIALGTNCQNNGCTVTYEGSDCNKSFCLYHSGVPIFHEGLKYWSCCQRKTSDFDSFLNQEGCKEGNHLWKKESFTDTTVDCRWDYHQTGPYIIISIYAKQYSPTKSVVKLNPIRLYTNLVFPKQNNATFELDVELKGIIDVPSSVVTMYGTKVEIKMKKAEAGNWSKLEANIIKKVEPPKVETKIELPKIEAVDLSDL